MEIRILLLPYTKGVGAKFTYNRRAYEVRTIDSEVAEQQYNLEPTTYDGLFLASPKEVGEVAEVIEAVPSTPPVPQRPVSFTGEQDHNYIPQEWWLQELQKHFPNFKEFEVCCHHSREALNPETVYTTPEKLRIGLFASNARRSSDTPTNKCQRELYGIKVNCLDTQLPLENPDYSWRDSGNTQVWGIIQNTLYILTDLTHENGVSNWKENSKKILSKIFQEATTAYQNIKIDCAEKANQLAREKLLAMLNKRNRERKNYLGARYRNAESAVQTCLQVLETKTAEYAEVVAELESFVEKQASEADIAEVYKQIAKYGTIAFPSDNVLEVKYTKPVKITSRFKYNGLWWWGTFDMGFYTLTVNLKDCTCRFKNPELYAKCHYPHPHVNSRDDGPCFGTGSNDMINLFRTQDIVGIVRMCYVFLTKYSEASPYSCLHSYLPVCEERCIEGKEESKLTGDAAKDLNNKG